MVHVRRIVDPEWLLSTLQSRYSTLFYKTWHTIIAALFRIKSSSGALASVFAALFWQAIPKKREIVMSIHVVSTTAFSNSI